MPYMLSLHVVLVVVIRGHNTQIISSHIVRMDYINFPHLRAYINTFTRALFVVLCACTSEYVMCMYTYGMLCINGAPVRILGAWQHEERVRIACSHGARLIHGPLTIARAANTSRTHWKRVTWIYHPRRAFVWRGVEWSGIIITILPLPRIHTYVYYVYINQHPARSNTEHIPCNRVEENATYSLATPGRKSDEYRERARASGIATIAFVFACARSRDACATVLYCLLAGSCVVCRAPR